MSVTSLTPSSMPSKVASIQDALKALQGLTAWLDQASALSGLASLLDYAQGLEATVTALQRESQTISDGLTAAKTQLEGYQHEARELQVVSAQLAEAKAALAQLKAERSRLHARAQESLRQLYGDDT